MARWLCIPDSRFPIPHSPGTTFHHRRPPPREQRLAFPVPGGGRGPLACRKQGALSATAIMGIPGARASSLCPRGSVCEWTQGTIGGGGTCPRGRLACRSCCGVGVWGCGGGEAQAAPIRPYSHTPTPRGATSSRRRTSRGSRRTWACTPGSRTSRSCPCRRSWPPWPGWRPSLS